MLLHSKSSLGGERFHKQGDQTRASTAGQHEHARDDVNEPVINAYCVFCKLPHSAHFRYQHDATCACCESPLSLAEPVALEKSCRRAVKRVAKDARVHFYTDWPQRHRPGRLQDISPNGMSFMTSEYVAEAQIIKLVSGLLHAVAEVMSCQSSTDLDSREYSVGVHFLTLRFQQSTGTFVYDRA